MKPSDYLALSIATCGVGYLPLMPGTFGSLLAVGIFLLVAKIATGSLLVALVLILILASTVVGIWAGTRTEELLERKDPGRIVIDEVAGQFIALFPITLLTRWSIWVVIISLILFRFFDIVKPYPANRLQELKGGAGVMFDDLVAGVYGAVVVSLILIVF